MTDQPIDTDLTPEEAGIWDQGFDPEDAPAPLSGDELAQALAEIDTDAPVDLTTDEEVQP